MLFKRRQNERQRGRSRLAPTTSGQLRSPAFSYYANRTPAPQEEVKVLRQKVSAGDVGQQPKKKRRALTWIGFLLTIAALVFCLFKLSALSTDPNVVIVNQTSLTQTYTRPVQAYTSAANKIMKANLADHLKPFADTTGIANALKRKFPELQTVSVSLPLLGSRPTIYVAVTRPSLVLKTKSGDMYVMNSRGILLAQLHGNSSDVPIVTDQTGIAVDVGRQALPSSTVQFIQTVLGQLEAKHEGVSGITLVKGSGFEVDMHLLGKPFTVRFNLEASAKEQAGALLATLHTLGSDVPTSYVDVRTPGRVYYK